MSNKNQHVGLDVGLWVAFVESGNGAPSGWHVYDNDFGLAHSPEDCGELNEHGRQGLLEHFSLGPYAHELPLEAMKHMSYDELENWRSEALH